MCLKNNYLSVWEGRGAHNALVASRLGEGGFKAALDEWAQHGGKVSER